MKKTKKIKKTSENIVLREKIKELLELMKNSGPKSEPVRKFILANKNLKDFEDVALVIVNIAEDHWKAGHRERVDNPNNY
jgi:hypothetical protein